MTLYQLYLESGPRHKKTMLHVLDLLGANIDHAVGHRWGGAIEADVTPPCQRQLRNCSGDRRGSYRGLFSPYS